MKVRSVFLILLCICVHVLNYRQEPVQEKPAQPVLTIAKYVIEIEQEKVKEQEELPPERLVPSYQDLINELGLPTSMSLDEYHDIDYIIKPNRINYIIKIGDILLLPTELLLDGTVSVLNTLFGQSDNISSKIFDFRTQPTRSDMFSTLVTNLIRREQRYFGRIDNAYYYTDNPDDADDIVAEMDTERLVDDQRKILWDTFKDTYLSKYKLKLDDKVRDEAFRITDWSGVDFIVLPPLVVGYLYYRGYDKQLSIFGSRLRVSFESIHKLTTEDNILVGIGLEWSPYKNSPIKLIAATGLNDGEFELQFIGIGTSLDAIKKVLYLKDPEDPK